jgi:sulfur-oxidizing protein SoxY
MNSVNSRRHFLFRGLLLLSGAWALARSQAARAYALIWNESAFAAITAGEGMKIAGYENALDHPGLILTAPELAENGAVVPLEIESRIAGTQRIAIFVDANPNPMVAEFLFLGDTPAYVSTRIKMASTSLVRVLAKTPSGVWQAAQPVKVTLGGCGG